MENQKLIFREDVVIRLNKMFQEDYWASIAEFPQDKKIEFVEHLLEGLDIVETFPLFPTKENWKIFTNKDIAFLKMHGKRLKVYVERGLSDYFDRVMVLLRKPIYNSEEWSSLSGAEQIVSPNEFAIFFRSCRIFLFLQQNSLLTEQKPVDIIKNKTFELKNDNFKDVYDKLKPEYIKCTLPQFKKIFSGVSISEEEKIQWLGSRASLNYFLTKTFKPVSWKIANNCFKIEGKSLEGQKLKNDKSPKIKDKQNINKAINQFQFRTSFKNKF